MEIDFMNVLHKSTKRDYLARVNDKEFPKAKAANLAKKFDFDYWDGDRRICYGGYNYIEGRWEKVANKIANHYKLQETLWNYYYHFLGSQLESLFRWLFSTGYTMKIKTRTKQL